MRGRLKTNEKILPECTGRRHVRFPDDEEIMEFLDEAIPIAEREAAKNKMDLEIWMLADAMCSICPEFSLCDQKKLEEAVERVYIEMMDRQKP